MGWASYQEDIEERISDLNHQIIEPASEAIASLHDRASKLGLEAEVQRLQVIVSRVENFRDELEQIATNPDIQLAFELLETQRRVDRLQAKAQTYEPTIQRLRQDIAPRDEEIKALKAGRREDRRKARRLEDEVHRLHVYIDGRALRDRDELERLIDQYPPPRIPRR